MALHQRTAGDTLAVTAERGLHNRFIVWKQKKLQEIQQGKRSFKDIYR